VRVARLAPILSLAVAARGLRAQCPDGTPPPCRSTRVAAAPAPNSVAVLYFESRSADTNDLALADGLTEEIINRLSGIERLTVRSRYLVRRYRGTALEDPAAVGRSLSVAYLVSGSVRRAGGRLRVSAELVRASGGAQVWGQQFDQSGDDVFAIQEAVAREVATGIVGRLLPAEQQTLAARPTTSAVAYDAFLRGNFLMARRDSVGMRRAVEEFERALRADPAYTDALSRIALAYGLAAGNGFDVGLSRDTVAARAVRNAAEAVRRAPNSSDAWVAMGIASLAEDPRHPQPAREGFERAIALDPANAEAHHLLGFTLALLGQDTLGIEHDRMALAIEPARPVTIMHLAQLEAKLGHYAETRRWVDSALAIDREFWSARAARLWLLLQAGDTAGARAEAARWRDLQPLRSLALLAELALAPHQTDSASVRAWRASLRAAIPAEVPVSSGLGVSLLVMFASGDPDLVATALEAVRPRGAFLHQYLTWVAFDPIRQDPRFDRLFRETMP
jgi:TolB-like protein/Tfp pilus assembly protein PilF